MNNIAIIIGINNYINVNALPACLNDSNVIDVILKNANKYSDILCINNENTDSYTIREQIINLVEKYKDKEINELFFYFSGHGQFDDSDFYYITTDTEVDKINSTSLQNNELDTILKKLNPYVFVKIIDACQSGISYIKGKQENSQDNNGKSIFQKSFQDKAFNKCIFMSSSHSFQSSYATNKMSKFTESFVNCIMNTDVFKTLRYSHIINSISDYFENNKMQKPFFVLQADMTEEFCKITQELIDNVKPFIPNIDVDTENKDISQNISLEEKISQTLDIYATFDETNLLSEKIRKIIFEYSPSNNLIAKIFTVKKNTNLLTNQIPVKLKLCEWIEQNAKSLRLFAYATYEKVKDGFYEYEKLSGFASTSTKLISAETVEIIPQNIAIPKFTLVFVYLYSNTTIYLFNTYVTSEPTNWGQFNVTSLSGWNFFDIEIKNPKDYEKKVNEILENFETFILDSLDKYLN